MAERDSSASPYKGLMPYSEQDAPFFFGRETDRRIILSNLMALRLTLLYGASGVGKSSVLRGRSPRRAAARAEEDQRERQAWGRYRRVRFLAR